MHVADCLPGLIYVDFADGLPGLVCVDVADGLPGLCAPCSLTVCQKFRGFSSFLGLDWRSMRLSDYISLTLRLSDYISLTPALWSGAGRDSDVCGRVNSGGHQAQLRGGGCGHQLERGLAPRQKV